MSDPHQRHITRIFLRASELQGDARESYLDKACKDDPELRREIESLLGHDLPSVVFSAGPTSGSAPPETLGRYRLLRELGRGGMGVVYLAEQTEPVRRQVALKVIKLGMDTDQVVARFESERQALALMSHPSIAQVLDAGAAEDGRPFFVMEYVDGVPITEYCDARRLTTRQRLELFQQVADGVQHAHQKAIIHRDLKPSNILVSVQGERPVPKIIDFGIAKATAQPLTGHTIYTEMGVLIGTPEYMSPEQAAPEKQDVDTRTDVYSLGVLLYELLTGCLPFGSRAAGKESLEQFRRRILEEDAPPATARLRGLGQDVLSKVAAARRSEPRRLAGELRGDLDAIVRKALERDRDRRYGSPHELKADIGRHLRHEPIEARPPGAWYLTRKFVRRHRAAVGLVLAAAVVLAGLAARERAQSRRIAAERDRASLEAATASSVTDFVLDLFDAADHHRTPGMVTARELLDRSVLTLDSELQGEPVLKARFVATIAGLYQRLGLLAEAEPLHRRALEARRQHLGPDHLETLEGLAALAGCLTDQGRYDEAAPLYEQVLSVRRARLGQADPAVVEAVHDLARLRSRQGDGSRAEALYRQALEAQTAAAGRGDPRAAGRTMNALAWLLITEQRLEEAEALLRQTLDLLGEAAEPDPDLLVLCQGNLSYLYGLQGRDAEARPLTREVLAAWGTWAAMPGDAAARHQYALRLLTCKPEDLQDPAEALRVITEAAEITRFEHAPILNILAMAHHRNGETERAVDIQRQALARLPDDENEPRRRIWEENLRQYEGALQGKPAAVR